MTDQQSNTKRESDKGSSPIPPSKGYHEAVPDSFRRELDQHSKAALVNLVDQLTSDGQVNRGWMLKYLKRVDKLLTETGGHLPDRLTAQQFLLIARYEMYASLSLEKGKDVTEAYMGALTDPEHQLLDEYLNVKVQALCGEMVNFDRLPADGECETADVNRETGEGRLKKTADSVGAEPAGKSESLNNQ